jgi:hypothetical protein
MFRAGIVTIHPITRSAVLRALYPSQTLALQNAIWCAKQDIDRSDLRHLLRVRLYVGDDDEIQQELRRLRLMIAHHVDTVHHAGMIPNIYTVITSPYINELS